MIEIPKKIKASKFVGNKNKYKNENIFSLRTIEEKKEKISTTNIISLRNCYIKEAAQRICENFGRKIKVSNF